MHPVRLDAWCATLEVAVHPAVVVQVDQLLAHVDQKLHTHGNVIRTDMARAMSHTAMTTHAGQHTDGDSDSNDTA